MSTMSLIFLFRYFVCLTIGVHAGGILYPRPSESREVLPLDGLWKFTIGNKSEQNKGFNDQWYSKPLDQV